MGAAATQGAEEGPMIAAVFGFGVWLLIDTAVVAFVRAAWDAGRAGECGGSSSRVEGGA